MPYIAIGLLFWNQQLHLIRHVRLVPSLVHSIACCRSVVTEPAHELIADNVSWSHGQQRAYVYTIYNPSDLLLDCYCQPPHTNG
jgi:hypothetical protein